MIASISGSNTFRNIMYRVPLIAVCVAVILISVPAISANIKDPNMIVYFNADEGGLMDEAWYYYSGVKRDSFQWDFDYGLEMVYLADLARALFSKFIDFTPVTFVVILHWIHLIAGVLAILALWRLVNYHFGKGWQPIMAVTFLVTRPSFIYYFSNNIKPEPLILLFSILCLDYLLRIIDDTRRRDLFIAIALASIAFVVKFTAVSLLPPIVAAMYLAKRRKNSIEETLFRPSRATWPLSLLIGSIIIIAPLLLIFFYVRKSTGHTLYSQFGLWGSLLQSNFIFYIWAIGFLIIFSTPILGLLAKSGNLLMKRTAAWVNEINSYALIVCGLFLVFVMLFGFGWLFHPKQFVQIYGQLAPIASQKASFITAVAEKGFLASFFDNLMNKLRQFDPLLVALFVFYLVVELYRARMKTIDRLQAFKRLTLLVFVIPAFLVMLSSLRIEQHNMLPFVMVVLILVIQGILIFKDEFDKRILLKGFILAFTGALLMVDILTNGIYVVKHTIYQSLWREDVAFDIVKWWREKIPVNARVVADHYIRVYIPEEYTNVETLNWNQLNKAEEMRRLVAAYKPQYVYYNSGLRDEGAVPPLEEILPNRRLKLLKSFESAGRLYQRNPHDRFVIYKVLD